MNARRIAALLRELADELDGDDVAANDSPGRRRKLPPPPRPARVTPVSELDAKRADQALRRLGYRVRP